MFYNGYSPRMESVNATGIREGSGYRDESIFAHVMVKQGITFLKQSSSVLMFHEIVHTNVFFHSLNYKVCTHTHTKMQGALSSERIIL